MAKESVSLASLAVLKVHWDAGQGDYVSNFLPFALDCIRATGMTRVTAAVLRTALDSEYGLKLPDLAVETLINRAVREGYLERPTGEVVPVSGRIA